MKGKVIINPKTRLAYIPQQIVDSGYSGEVETIANAVTVTLIKPNTPLEDIKRSLEITIQDIELQMKQERK